MVIPYSPALFPTSQISRNPLVIEAGLREDFVLIQEIRMSEDYLQGIDVALENNKSNALNQNMLIILDSARNILYRKPFTSKENDNEWFSFRMSKPVYAGCGKKIYICLAGNGTRENFLRAFCNVCEEETGLYAVRLQNGNIQESLADHQERKILHGTLIYRLYETRHPVAWPGKLLLTGLALIISLGILLFPLIRTWVTGHPLSPWKAYAFTASVAGLGFCFLNPPFQSPDENEHFFRAYQLSELQLYGWHRTIPASLVQFESRFTDAFFGHYYTVSFKEIFRPGPVMDKPNERVERKTKDDIVGYIPQAVAAGIARACGLPHTGQLLAARLINLAMSVLLISLAIRKIPAGKWLLFLLGMMPMTLLLMSSPSYFSIRIGLAFLVIAWLLDLAWGPASRVSLRNWLWLCLLAILLGMSQFPYIIIFILVVLIPRGKFGTTKRYVSFIVILALSVGFASPVWKGDQLFHRFNTDRLISEHGLPADATSSVKMIPGADNMFVNADVDESGQKNIIIRDPVRFLSVVFNTVRDFGWFYLRSFVGIMGWLTVELPVWLVISFLLALCISVVAYPAEGIHFSTMDRLLFPGLFILGFLIIEAGLYITWTPFGANHIEGVQGWYFIPYAPLLFLVMLPGRNRIPALHSYRPYLDHVFVAFTGISACTALYAIVDRFYSYQ
jgi:uncharacterized membrane protein